MAVNKGVILEETCVWLTKQLEAIEGCDQLYLQGMQFAYRNVLAHIDAYWAGNPDRGKGTA